MENTTMDTVLFVFTPAAVFAIALAIKLFADKRRMNKNPLPPARIKDPDAWQLNVDTQWHD
jgi:hypothetical protein